MINLITGLPGNGKTLFTISYVKQLAEKDNRPVFYSGIKDLNIPSWQEIDAEKWFDAPPRAIVVIDECQRVFRPRTISKDTPPYVSELETHRHGGIDLFLITQHPMLADSAIRRLTNNHRHVIRTFGTERATIHEWGSVKDNCDKSSARKDSIKHMWKFDKSAYSLYKSAEVHTVKRSIPTRIYFLLLAPLLIAAAVFYMYRFVKSKSEPVVEPVAVVSANGSNPVSSGSGAIAKVSYKNAVEDAKEYVYLNQPRVEGMPSSAPKYDQITAPTVAPVPSGCVATKTKCSCYTQQATPIKMDQEMCIDIVKNGYFQDFDPNMKRSDREKPAVVRGAANG